MEWREGWKRGVTVYIKMEYEEKMGGKSLWGERWRWSLKLFLASRRDVCSAYNLRPVGLKHHFPACVQFLYVYRIKGSLMAVAGRRWLTFRSLWTISCWWIWLMLSRIWLMQWLKKTKDKRLCQTQQQDDRRVQNEGFSSITENKHVYHPWSFCVHFNKFYFSAST